MKKNVLRFPPPPSVKADKEPIRFSTVVIIPVYSIQTGVKVIAWRKIAHFETHNNQISVYHKGT